MYSNRLLFLSCILVSTIIGTVNSFAQTTNNGPAINTSISLLDENLTADMEGAKALSESDFNSSYSSTNGFQMILKYKNTLDQISEDASGPTPEDMKTMMLSKWEYSLIKEAEIAYLTRDPDSEEDFISSTSEEVVKGPREIFLGGISYISKNNWTIWLNSQRITPSMLPEELISLDVQDTFVELEWYDEYTNTIYPVRLKPNERFNIDSQIFLTGPGAG